MKIKTIILSLILFLLVLIPAMAQDTADDAAAISEQFPYPVLRGWSNSAAAAKYYRFDSKTPYFDPLDLSYFPQEILSSYTQYYVKGSGYEPDWELLARWKDGKNDIQQIYLEEPAEGQIIHGKEIGNRSVFLKNFYLYADLFVMDNYPENTGSCFLYFSNSMMTGVSQNSSGLLIDPENGIYKVRNTAAGEIWRGFQSYNPFAVQHNLEKIENLTPSDYPVAEDRIEAASAAASGYPKENLDQKFAEDWDFLKNAFRMPANPEVHPYRMEIVRMDGRTTVYINGKNVAELKDGIYAVGENGTVLDKVSWSYGPLLNEGGLTVSCAVGNFAIYATGPNGD